MSIETAHDRQLSLAPNRDALPYAREAEAQAFLTEVCRVCDVAFQPIVNAHSGTCFGLEALLRGHEDLGFREIHEVFDYAHDRGWSHRLDAALREVAIEKFSRLANASEIRLFFNVDNRAIQSPEFDAGEASRAMRQYGLPARALCIELSERHEIASTFLLARAPGTYRTQSFSVAIDDFGAGYAGFKLLYQHQPDFIKIDRFFISGIHADPKKKLFASKIVSLAHVLHIMVIAEGVETEKEFLACKDIGCDLMQGYLIQHPITDVAALQHTYDHILSRRDMRARKGDPRIVEAKLEVLPTMPIDMPPGNIFEQFRQNKRLTFFPVIDANGHPLGVVKEEDLKEYTYSNYGKELLTNKRLGFSLRQFLSPCPTAEIDTEIDEILEKFSLNENSEGVIIVDDLRYVGFLSARSLLQVINEKNIASARDENPLTRLPGNTKITAFVSAALAQSEESYAMLFFDFDNFKPFNDIYGFRQGDRAILLFADLMRKIAPNSGTFLGHVGGDDFFAGIKNSDFDSTMNTVTTLLADFKHQVETFYDRNAREAGFIVSKDREGQSRRFPLMTVSAAVLLMPQHRDRASLDVITRLIADLKKEAKARTDGICVASHVDGPGPVEPTSSGAMGRFAADL